MSERPPLQPRLLLLTILGPAALGLLAALLPARLGLPAPGGFLVLLAVIALQCGIAAAALALAARRRGESEAELEVRAAALRRAAAEEAERGRARLIATAAHEIRTPLNGIAAMLEGALATPGLPRDARDSAEKAVEGVRDLVQLLRDLVEMPDGEHLPLISRPFRLEDALQDVVKLLTARAAAAGLDLSFAIAPGTAPAWRGDAGRLRQILVQLVANGLRATTRGGVKVDASQTAHGLLELRVTDTGRGIPTERIGRLFEPLGGPEGGSSLGLAVCRDLVRRMGGDIAVASTVGHGSVFTVTLPLARASLSDVEALGLATAAAPRRLPLAGPAAGTVLVVDDVAVNRRLLGTVLARLGYATEEAADGETALALAAAGDHVAVLMDVEMPGMDGLETTRRLRALPGPAGRLAVIAVTAHRSQEGEAACRAAGMDHYLVKPVAAADLAAILARTVTAGARAS